MTAFLSRPLAAGPMTCAALALALAVAAYCMVYSRLAGEPERLEEALVWAAANVLPWFGAFEAAKRARSRRGWFGALAAGFGLSMALELSLSGLSGDAGFEALRRLPALSLVAGLLWIGRLPPRTRPVRGAGTPLPLPTDQIDRVAAAGNYVEIRARGGSTLTHRASLAEVERELTRHGFVRIHRCHLVRRDSIARVRPADVILRDGTSLKTGKRFRAGLGG